MASGCVSHHISSLWTPCCSLTFFQTPESCLQHSKGSLAFDRTLHFPGAVLLTSPQPSLSFCENGTGEKAGEFGAKSRVGAWRAGMKEGQLKPEMLAEPREGTREAARGG